MNAAERKRAQRQRDRLAGWVEVTLKVAAGRVEELRDFAASLPPPEPPTDPAQLSLLDQLDRRLQGGGDGSPDPDGPEQGRLL